MISSLASSPPVASLLRRPWRAGLFSKFFAFAPLWIRIYGYFAWQTFSSPMFTGASEPLGIPPGVVVDGLVLVWMSIGAYVLWGAKSRRVAAVVYVVFTIPATFALMLGPALVLILQNAT